MPPRPRLTHFLCLPLVTPASRPQLQASLNTFRDDVAQDRTPENPNGVPEQAIRPLGTLHLTIGVMSLLTQEEIESALRLLGSLKLKEMLSERSEQLRVTLRGLSSMHTPSKTSILYAAPADNEKRLQSFCEKLKEAFVASDLLVPDTRPLLLHATIVNTIYVPGIRRGNGSGHGKNRAKMTVDAREILERYEGFEWMSDVTVEKVAICRMGAQKMEDGNEEYVVEGDVNIPV